jgi:hypothetical protein
MSNLDDKRPNKKVILLIIGVIILVAVAILSLASYYGPGQVAGVSEVSVQAKVTNDYTSDINKIFRNYLILTDESRLLTEQFRADTTSIKQQVLDLKTPRELTDSHLSIVVSLNAIENGILVQDLGAIVGYVYELRSIIDNI